MTRNNACTVFALVAIAVLSTNVKPGVCFISESGCLSGEEKGRHRADFKIIEALINNLSKGRSKLSIITAVTAAPGIPTRLVTPGLQPADSSPYVSVYPISSPLKTSVDGVGEGIILGAVHVLEATSGTDSKKKAPVGVYMLFLRVDSSLADWRGMPQSLLLVSVKEYSGGAAKAIVFKEEGFASCLTGKPAREKINIPVDAKLPYVSAEFGNPDWRVNLGMVWTDSVYYAAFDMNIKFE